MRTRPSHALGLLDPLLLGGQRKLESDPNSSWDVGILMFKSWRNLKEIETTPVKQERLKKILDRMITLYWDMVPLTLDLLSQQRARPPAASKP